MLRDVYWRVRNKLLKRYRIELIDDETLSQSRQYAVKPITVVLLAALLFTLTVGGTAALVIYTPIMHRLIPGYIDPAEYRLEREKMAARVLHAEQEIDRWMAYYASFKQLAGVGTDTTVQGLSQTQLDSIRLSVENQSSPAPPATNYTESQKVSLSANHTSDGVQEEPTTSQPVEISSPPASPQVPAVKISKRSVLDELFPPIEGTLNNGFSFERRHYGVDIVANENTMIRAATDGTVIISDYSEDNGWVIGIAGPDDVMTLYKHNSRLLKDTGAFLKAGEPIAVIGNTGENSSGPHLHFELWQNGRALDPEDYINFQ